MRLWSIHPKYLDSKGLVALWRESLLAQKVLQGKTKGYLNHPQLIRFKNTNNPVGAIAEYLRYVLKEAVKRGYNFDRNKIVDDHYPLKIPVTEGQLDYEISHLLRKLELRDSSAYKQLKNSRNTDSHPIFAMIKGTVEDWEIV